MKNLNIYKASAGSGKTYTLAKEYIATLLAGNDPQEYRHILAVTFTNKATEEMKNRIITELGILAGNPEDSDFVKEKEKPICKNDSESLAIVKEKAEKILISLLNDYSSFNICTIDKFFQSVMRSFAKEFGQHYKYNIELDEKGCLERSIDRMYSELDKDESRELLNWLVEYALSKVESSGSWNIKEEINDISQILLKEVFVQNNSHVYDPSLRMKKILELRKKLTSCREDFEKKAYKISDNAVSIITRNGLALDNFKNGKASGFSIFYKIHNLKSRESPAPGKRFSTLDNIDEWGKKGDDFSKVASDGLMQQVLELQKLYNNDYRRYRTAIILEKYAFAWGVLDMVRSYLTSWCTENNIVLLSESSNLLNRIIDGSQTPFIYERVGTCIRHFMLDEFQDTSTMQWKNFIPLLEESLSNGNSNLIVGDVKQSIYRWRNSNWSILGQEVNRVFEKEVSQERLDKNFRSNRNIIEFNNSFFSYFSQNINSSEIEAMYSDCTQLQGLKRESDGYVEISFHPNAKEMMKEYCNIVVEKVQLLIQRGYLPSQIGILTWQNKEGEQVAQALMEHGIGVATVGTLTLGSNATVCSVIDSLKEIDQDNDMLRAAKLAIGGGEAIGLLGEEVIEEYKRLPLYQMAESIIRNSLGDDEKKESQFLCALLDAIIEFSQTNGGSLHSFLQWWEETGSRQTVSSSSQKNAVNIVTIHKSKGLAYDAVIVPFFEWDLKPGGRSTIWSNAASEAFGYDQPVNVSCSSSLEETLFDRDWQREKIEHKADMINMAYVAFTRAKSSLMVMCQLERDDDAENRREKNSELTSRKLKDFMEYNSSLADSDSQKLNFKEENCTYRLGEIRPPAEGSGNRDEKSMKLASPFSIEFNAQRRKTALTTGSVNDEEMSIKDLGIQMHEAFATIQYLDDIQLLENAQTREAVEKAVESVRSYGWFWNRNENTACSKVVNERSIVTGEGEIFRPDRLIIYKNPSGGNNATVIDYKFGKYRGTNMKYVRQVQGYMNLLKDIGCKEVKGYLWYVNSTVEEVKTEL